MTGRWVRGIVPVHKHRFHRKDAKLAKKLINKNN